MKLIVLVMNLFIMLSVDAQMASDDELMCIDGKLHLVAWRNSNCYGSTIPYISNLDLKTIAHPSLRDTRFKAFQTNELNIETNSYYQIGHNCGNPRGWPRKHTLPIPLNINEMLVSLNGVFVGKVYYPDGENCYIYKKD